MSQPDKFYIHAGRKAVEFIVTHTATGLTRCRVTPNRLTAAGISLCIIASVLVYFQDHSQSLYWVGAGLFALGTVFDVFDGTFARATGNTTPSGEFMDSVTDRIGECAMLIAIGLVFAASHHIWELFVVMLATPGSFLVSYTRSKAEKIGINDCTVGWASRFERCLIITVGLILAPWGGLRYTMIVLAAMAWITVIQRTLFVHNKLKGQT